MEKLVKFFLSFELYIFNVYIGNIKDLSQLKVEIELKPEKLIDIFKDYGCIYLLQNLELKQLQNEISYLDFQEKKIELNLGSQIPIQIFKLPFFVKFNKINACLQLSDPILIKGSLHCAFQWYEKDVCTLKAIIDNQNKQIFKLELDYEQPPQDLKNVLCQFFEQYFENNYFISKLVDMKELIIKKLDMITNALCWNFQMEIQINLDFKIFGEITFLIKSIDIYCHIDSNKCEFSIVSTIEFLKFIMEIGIEIDFFQLFSNQRSKSLKMIFRKAQNCPTFKEILSIYSPRIDSILEKIPGYKELKIKDKIKDLKIQNPDDLLDVNRFKKLGSSIFEEFKLQANERVQCTEQQIREEFEKELIKGKEQTKMMLEDGKQIVNQQIQNVKDKVNSNINELNQNIRQKKQEIEQNLTQGMNYFNDLKQKKQEIEQNLTQGMNYFNDLKLKKQEIEQNLTQGMKYFNDLKQNKQEIEQNLTQGMNNFNDLKQKKQEIEQNLTQGMNYFNDLKQKKQEIEQNLTQGMNYFNDLKQKKQEIEQNLNQGMNYFSDLKQKKQEIEQNLTQGMNYFNDLKQKKQEIEQNVNQGMNYFNDLKLQGEEQISKCQQTIQDAKANLEKQINHQIEQQKEKAKKFGQDAFSQLSQLANSRESYLEFRNDSIEFKFDIPLLDEWKICRFITLSDCNLQFSNIEKELIIDLKGKIKFLDIQFPEFSLLFSLKKPPIIFFDKKPLVQGFDPIQYGLKLFDLQCEETNLFPTINQIDIFQFNFENQEFESQFSFNSENCQEKNSVINFSTISMRIQYKQQLVKQKLNSDIQAMLKTSILLFGLKINLNLDFSFLATNYRTNSSLKFVLESEPIENFCLNKFVQHILSFEIPSHIAEFKIQNIICKLSIEKSKQWEFFFLLSIEDGSCNFFQNVIIIKALTGQLIYNKESGWDDSSIRGECIVKNQSLGSFKFGFLKDRKQIQADLIPNKTFSLEKLFQDLSGCDLKMSIFQEINFQNLTLMLEIFESQMLFKAIYKKDNLKFDNFSFIQLKDVNVEFQLINKQVISKNLQIDFKIVLFKNQNFVIDGKITGFPLKVDKFVLPIRQTIFALFDILREFDLYKIHKFQLFEECPIQVEFVVNINTNMKVENFEIIGTYQGKIKWSFLQITSIRLKYSRENGQNNFVFEGNVILLDVYKLQFSYCTQNKKLKFLQIENDKNTQQMIQLTKSLFENQNNYQTTISNFKVMVEKIPSFQELVINFENKSFLLALSNSSSQVYKIYLNWQSKTLLFYFCIKGKFCDITSLFSVLDSFFCFQQSECLLIYSKQGDSLDDDLIEENSNNLISSYLKNQNKKSIGLNLITQIKFKIQPNLEKFFSFLENPKKEFDLKFNALFENGFEFQSEKYKYNTKQFQGSLYFYLQGIQQQINFKIYLSLKYVTQNWGELNFKGEVNGSQITSFKGGLELEYKNAFGVNDWDIKGTANLIYENQNLSFSTQITTEIKGFTAELRLNLSNFKPVGLGIMLQNINLRKILRFFNLEEKIPSEFLNYIPNIQKLGVIFGEMPDDYKKSIFPEKLYNLVNSKSLFAKVVEKIVGENLEQKFFLIQSSSDSKQFIFDLALYQSAIGKKFFCKGHLKVDISPHLLIGISLDTQFDQDQFKFDGKGTIKILEENQLDINVHFKPNQFAFQLAIMIQNLKFELGLEAKFENNILINANIEYDIQKNKGWQQQTYWFFKYIEVKQIVLRLDIDEQQIKCKLKYSIKIVDFKQFEGDFEISFDINVIQNLISLTFEQFAQFFSCLPGFNQNTDNLQFKKMLNKNAKKIKKFCKNKLNTDVSEELDALREQFDEEDNRLIEPKSHNSQTQNPQNPKPSQSNQNKQRQPSLSPSPPKASQSKQPQKPTQQNQNKQRQPSLSPSPPKASQSKQPQKPTQQNQNKQRQPSSSSSPSPPKASQSKQSQKPSQQNQNIQLQLSSSPLPLKASQSKQHQKPSQQNQNKQRQPSSSSSPSPPKASQSKRSQKPSQQNQNIQLQLSSSPLPLKASQSKQHQKSPQKNENNQSSSSPSSVPSQKTQLLPLIQPPPILTPTPIQSIQPPPSTQPQQQEFKEKTDKEQNSKKNQNKNDIQRFFQNLNEQEIKKKNNNPQQQNRQDEPIQKSLQIEKQESVKSDPANEKNDPENEKNQENCSIIDLDMIKSLKNWSFDEDLKACNVSKQLLQDSKIVSKQQPRGLQIDGEPKIQEYDQLLSSAEAEIAFEWKNQEQKDIVSMNGRLIINNQTYTESILLQLGHLLIKLQFLHQKYDIILSGNCKPVSLKNQDIPLSINLIDKIFHGLYGQFNEKLIPVDLNDKYLNDFIIVFTENKLTISDQCKKELISDEIKIVYIFEKAKIFSLDVKSGEINEVSISLLEILGEISQQKKKLNKSKIKQTINTREIENLDIQDLSHLNIKEANNLKSLLEISKYTKYSLSSKGTTIDIKGIIKFFCTNGTAKDIMKKKNKGGKSLYVFQVVLDLNSFSRACLINVIIPFVYHLIEFCKECKIICNLHIYSDPIILIKQNFSTIWSQQEQEQLLNSITNFNDNIQIEYNCNQLRFVSDNLTKFNSYKKYLIFINHQLYNYSYQDLSIFINQTQQQQIKLVSIGVDINKQTNRLMEGIFHVPLIESNDLYQIMNDLFEKKNQQELRIKKFEFKIDNQKFPNQVELEQFQYNGLKSNQYLNRFFNYVSKNDQNQNNEITQIQQQQKFSYELIQNKSITQVNECSVIAINKDCTIIIAGCSNQIRVFEFKQDQLKETQLLSQHEGKVNTLNFMKLQTKFVSGGLDKQIIIWIMNPGNQWVCLQKLIEHSDQIRCLALNNNEDLIISGSNDMKIKFWKQNIEWSCKQTIEDHKGNVLDLSINQQQNKVISCGEDEQILIIEYQQQTSIWVIIQKITEIKKGSRICFIDNDIFLLQLFFGIIMDIYEINSANQLFESKNKIMMTRTLISILRFATKEFISQPIQYINSKGQAVYTVENKLQFLRRNEQGQFQLEQEIKFKKFEFFGILSEDGQYLVSWELGENKIQIRKYHEIQ